MPDTELADGERTVNSKQRGSYGLVEETDINHIIMLMNGKTSFIYMKLGNRFSKEGKNLPCFYRSK